MADSQFVEGDLELLEKMLVENPLILNDETDDIVACVVLRSSRTNDVYDTVGTLISVTADRKAAVHCSFNGTLYVIAVKSETLRPNHSMDDLIKWLNTEEGKNAKKKIHEVTSEMLLEEVSS